MQIKCTECGRGINLPDGKIPRGRVFSITCPGCWAKIKVDKHLSSPASGLPASPAEKKREAANELEKSLGTVLSTEFEEEAEELRIYDENDRLALLLDHKNKDLWVAALEERGFKVQFAKSPEHAVHKMRFSYFHFVALHENYGGGPLERDPVYQLFMKMPMTTRRKIFFAVIGDKFKSLNNMEAFAYSVNLVVNERDADKFSRILKKSLSDHENFYKVFRESLQVMGQA